MSIFSISSQEALLDESLAFLSAQTTAALASNEPWWGVNSRQQLHGELFRYFVALGFYPLGEYVEAPRIALKVCVIGGQVRGRSDSPAIVRAVRLANLGAERSALRNLVRLEKLENDLKECFGANIFSGGISPGPTRLADQLVELKAQDGERFQRLPKGPIPHSTLGKSDFRTHVDVIKSAKIVLEQCLPFGDFGISLPKEIQQLFAGIDLFEDWLVLKMSASPPPAYPGIIAAGLALIVTARAYVVDVVSSLVAVSLPLHRLYEESRPRTTAPLDISASKFDRNRKPIQTKRAYNALMAVGLVELLTGALMPHMDSPPGNGYMQITVNLKDFYSLEPLLSFWKVGGGIHQQIIKALNSYISKPVQQVYYSPEKGKAPPPPQYITVSDLRKLMQQHAFPSLTIPAGRPQGKSPKPEREKRKDTSAYNKCGHFITHLQLYVATSLSTLLATKLKDKFPKIPEKGEGYINIVVGSLRWGGNHLPHIEHRDGFTYDVSIPNKYLPWPTASLKSLPRLSEIGKREPDTTIQAIGIPNASKQYESVRAQKEKRGKIIPITRDARLLDTFKKLITDLIAGKSGDDDSWNAFAGTPILLDTSNKPDDSGLVANLIGHVALTLGGPAKWIFSSWYEHLFALRAIGGFLAPGKCPAPLEPYVASIRSKTAKAEFYWAPVDHHDHWHVVFSTSTDRLHSLGPTHYRISQQDLNEKLRLWDELGVDLSSFARQFEKREVSNSGLFPDAVEERKTMLQALSSLEASIKKLSKEEAESRKERQDATLTLLANQIASTHWGDIPSLAKAKSYTQWVRDSDLAKDYELPATHQVPNWQPWPSDITPAPPETPAPPTDVDTDEN